MCGYTTCSMSNFTVRPARLVSCDTDQPENSVSSSSSSLATALAKPTIPNAGATDFPAATTSQPAQRVHTLQQAIGSYWRWRGCTLGRCAASCTHSFVPRETKEDRTCARERAGHDVSAEPEANDGQSTCDRTWSTKEIPTNSDRAG